MRRFLAGRRLVPLLLGSLLSVSALKGAMAQDNKAKLYTEVEGLKEYRLPNGLRVVLFPDASKPQVTVNITYFVGSRHEGYGEAGMAHLLEHMVFKGTPTRPDIWKLLQQQGANFNGTTWFDRTNYYEMLPASTANLEFALGLEADRMINSTIAPEALAKEFSVVRNEFEMNENDPQGILVEQMFHTGYQWHGYGRTTIGNRSDIEKVPVPKLREFYQRYYQPDNAMLVVAGAFQEAEALALIEKHFGPIKRPDRKLIDTYTVEPVQEGEREVVLRRQGEQAIVGVLYHTVSGNDPAFPAIDALADTLTRKPTGLLYKELVLKGLASEIGGSAYSLNEPGAVYFIAKVAKGKDPREVSKKLNALIEGLKPEQLVENDLRRYQAEFSRSFDLGMTDSARIGITLSEYAAMGDWRLLFLNRDRIESMKLADLRNARSYFKASNRTTGLFFPTSKPDRTPLFAKGDVGKMVEGYKGRAEIAAGESFDATFDNIQARTQYTDLPSGLKLAMLPKRSRGLPVTFSLALPTGSADTLKNKMVALHFLPKLMLRGTKNRDFEKIRDDLALMKATINGGASWDMDDPGSVSFDGKTVEGKLPEVLALFTEILTQPRFDKEQFDLIKKEKLTQLGEAREDPSEIASRAFIRTVGNYPKTDVRYIPTIDEEIKMYESVTLNDVKNIYTQLLGGGNGRLVMVGAFDPSKVKADLTAKIGNWKAKTAYQPIRYESKAVPAQVLTFNTPDKKGAQLAMGQVFSFKENDPRFAASRLAAQVWGAGGTSRLMSRLRQKDGLSYGAGGGLRADAKSDVGYLSAFAICAPQNVAKAKVAMTEELNKFAKEGITAEELTDAKQAYAEQRKNSLSRDNVMISLIGRNLELGRTMAYNKELDAKVQAATLEQVNGAIRELVQPEKAFVIEALDQAAGQTSAKND